MFTGIIEETGTVRRIAVSKRSIELVVEARRCARGLKVGDSLAVNGCCLTVVKLSPARAGKLIRFDLLRETWKRTNLPETRLHGPVNLERSLPGDGRLDGHFVTGHIDGTGTIRRWEETEGDRLLEVSAAPELMRYIVHKGSIALDGISLTVAGMGPDSFQVWIIPHTYTMTALRQRKVGDAVNLETDILGKYVERFLSPTVGAR